MHFTSRTSPSANRLSGWLDGLTLQGAGLILLVCTINAVRRTIQGVDWSAVAHVAGLIAWLADVARLTAWGLVIAVPVAVTVVVAWNRSPSRPHTRIWIVALAAASSAAFAIAGSTYLEYAFGCSLTGGCQPEGWASNLPSAYARYGLLCALMTVVFVYLRTADECIVRSRQAEVDRARFVQRMEQARLRMLQAQIEPHFLFNTLANVRRLYQTAPDDGARMLEHLMRYLHVALPQMRAPVSSLEREAALTHSYLEIQRLRMGPRLSFSIDIPPALRGASMPPMMVLTLAENAIKHGLAALPEGGHVRIDATARGARLTVRVADSGQGFTQTSGGGTGLSNIRARLGAMYGDAGRLALNMNSPRGIVATISIPLAPHANVAA
jgi:hypothetical protein